MLMKNKFLSKSVPRGTRTIWRYLSAFILLFTFAFGNVWAATFAPENNPATKKYGDITFLDVANTKANGKITADGATFKGDSTLAYSLRYVGQTLAITTWYNCSDGSPASNFENSPTYADAVINGFVAPSSTSGNIGYGGAKAHSSRIRYFYATGITSVAVFSHDNGSSKYVQLKIEEVAEDGTLSAVTTIDSPEKSSSTLSLIEYTTSLNPAKYYKISCTSNNTSNCKVYQIRFGKYIAPATKYTVTYKAGEGTGDDVVDSDAKTVKAFADCSFTAPSGYEFKEWQDGSSNVVAAGAPVGANMTLTAIYRLIPTKYTVTYSLNGASGDAPTETDKAEGDVFNLAAAPSWAGHAFDGWLCSADAAVKAAGSSYTMTAAATTFTAQWHELDCKIYSLTGGIGSAAAEADEANVVIDASSLVLKSSNAIIKLTPGSGTFKAGDILTISGTVGNTSKNFGVKISASNNKGSGLGLASVAGTSNPMVATATLSADADYLYICRDGGTTQTLLTCEVHRSCAEGIAAGLSYAETEVNKTEGDAAFTNTLTNANSLVLDGYKSSNEAVATVNFSNGQVTVVGPGSATITANSAVQTKAGVLYAAGTASYTLTVAACTPPRTPEFATTDPVVVTKNSATATWDVNGADASVAKYQVSVVKKSDASVVLDWTDCVYANPCTYTATGLDPETEYTFKLRSVGAAGYCALSDVVTEDFTTSADLADKYTVIFKDGDATLDTKQFDVASNPSDAGIEKTKPLYTFAAWQKEGVDIALDDAFWASVLKDAEIILTARWTKVYAMSIDMEQFVLDNSKAGNWHAYLDSKGYVYASSNMSLDSLDGGKTKNNYQYLGLKFNKNSENTYVEGNLAAGKLMVVKVGAIGNNTYMKIDGAKVTEPAIVGGVEADSAAAYTYWYYDTDKTFSLFHENGGTSMLKAITITDPYEVSFSGEGTPMAPMTFEGEGLTLPTTEPGLGNDKRFDHWCTDVDATIPVVLNAEGKFWPTGSCTLYAAYKTQYELSFVGNEATSGSMESLYYAEGDVVAVPACTFEKTGYVFDGWTYAPEVTVDVENNQFTMPGEALVLTAQWVDNSSVAKIGDTKYTNLDDAVTYALAHPGSEIVLLQDITRSDRITLNVDVTLNLNGHKLAKTDGGWLIFLEGGTFTVNGTTDNSEIHGGIAIGKATNVNANLVLNGGYYHRSGAVLHTNGTCLNSNVTINGATIESESDNAIQFNGYGIYNVDGATITGATGIYVKSGVLNVTNSTVTGTMAPADYSYYGNGAHATGDGVVVDACNYPGGAPTINIISGEFSGTKSAVGSYNYQGTSEPAIGGIISGTFSSRVPNELCAPNFVPSPQDPVTGKYTVQPKDGVEIIGVVTTGGTDKTVSGLYKGDAAVNLDGDKKIGSGKYIYVTLASGYTFEKTDVLVVDVAAKSDLPNNPALEITTGVGNIDGSVWKSIANADYELNLVTIPLTDIAANQTSIGLKRSDHQNTWVNGLKVYRPMKPVLTAITINGEACVKGTGNAYTITLPEEGTDLAALIVVPTVIWNAPNPTTPYVVVSNSGAWAEGANTYRVMDKDGDYTDYTITITLQGQAPAPVITTQPAGVAYCAGSEPTLEVVATGDELHYAWFKEAGETDEAVGTDAASYTIASAGTYYVVVTNHVDGKLDASVTSENAVVTLNVAAVITTQPTNKRDVVAGSEVTLSVVATNATGYQWYSCDDAEKHGAAAISGAEAADYVFNCNANGFYYCVVGNACGADIESNVVSVKLEPEGCNVLDGTIPSAAPYIYDNGEWTLYAVTSGGKLDGTSRFDDDAEDFDGNTVNAITYGRVGMTFAKDVESLTIYATSSSSDRAISSIKVTTDDVTTGTPSYSDVTFTASAEKLGKKDSSSPYRFVLEANNMLLEAGKKYWLQFSGTVSAFKICYSEALAMPVLPTLANQELCAGAAYETFDASITNAAACEGTVSYAWYKTTDTENPVATTATYTPTEDALYYVVVKHVKAGHMTRVAQSAELTVAHFAAPALVSYSEDVFQHMGTAAELSVVATGSGLAYTWYTCDVDGGNADVISGAETDSYAIASIAEGVQYYKVVISNNCDATTLSHIFKVEGWNQLEQVDVTASTVWDMNNVSASEINLASMTPSKQNVLLLLANIEGVNNNASFNSQALMFEGQRIGRTENNVKYVSGQYVQFNVTVPGMVSVTFASNGSAQRTILINGKQCSRTTNDGTYIKYDVAVEPGSVEIEDVQGYVRISKIEFKAEYSYHRENLNPNNIGTLCWTNNAVLGGATLYELAGKNEYNKLVFEEVDENRLEAGKPYIFVPENGNTEIKVYNTDSEEALTEPVDPQNGMMGTFVNLSTIDDGENSPLWNKYIISNNHYVYVDYANCRLGAYRAYITSLDDIAPANPEPSQNQNGAPRRRIVMGAQSEQVATGCENLNVSDKPVKMIINGQLFILRGEKMYDAKGQLVK